MRQDQCWSIAPESPVGGRYSAKVTVVDRVMDAVSGTFGVRLDFPNPGMKLPAGIRCKLLLSGVAGRTVCRLQQQEKAGPELMDWAPALDSQSDLQSMQNALLFYHCHDVGSAVRHRLVEE